MLREYPMNANGVDDLEATACLLAFHEKNNNTSKSIQNISERIFRTMTSLLFAP